MRAISMSMRIGAVVKFIHLNTDFVGNNKSFPFQNPLSPAPAKILARVCNAVTRHPIELESYLNHPRVQQVFCLKSKKTVFVFGLGFAEGTGASGGVFAFFGHLYLALDPNPFGHYFG